MCFARQASESANCFMAFLGSKRRARRNRLHAYAYALTMIIGSSEHARTRVERAGEEIT